MKKYRKALISVYNKENLKPLLSIFKKYKIEIISSGGTYKKISKLGYKCIEVSNYTNVPEILNGRLKTLHPKIHAGILSDRKKKLHRKQLKKLNFDEIDFVITNFYPFEKILQTTKNHNHIIKNIDIGGPAMVRAASKNYKYVTVITNPNQYIKLIEQLKKNNGYTNLNFRKQLCEAAFMETAYYDSVISNYFNTILKNNFPKKKLIYANLHENLKYGENPHQKSAIYKTGECLNLKLLNGNKLSYNNYNDIFSALLISKSFPKNTGTVIIKHSNPCGASINKDKLKSYKLALQTDPTSAFGGIVSCNFKIKTKLAIELKKKFLEVIICNGIEKNALKLLSKKQNLKIIDAKKFETSKLQNFVSNNGSILFQTSDNKVLNKKNFKIASKVKPDSKTLENLLFAFNVCRYTKSNAIVIVKNFSTIGIGSGQPSRLDSCKISIEKMNKFQKNNKMENIVAASDAYFPFVDGVEKLVQAGVTAIIQPAGSIRDKEIIKFANQTGISLIFSKTRHFRH